MMFTDSDKSYLVCLSKKQKYRFVSIFVIVMISKRAKCSCHKDVSHMFEFS